MESRMRDERNKLIDAFVQLARHENNDPVIVWCYPHNGLDEELRRSVPRFAFPFKEEFQSSNIDYFTFVLTAVDGKFRFGFCRMSAGSESTLCLISSYPWFEIFYKILNHLSDAQNSSAERLKSLLEDLSEIDPSIPGKRSLTFNVPGTQLNATFEYPNPNKLPSIPESRNLTEYYNAIDGYNMIIIFASMLFERRIIVTSRKLSRLTACVYGATSLIYPLNWQHIFIPVLPAHLLDYLSAPMPYLIGVHSSLLETVRTVEIDDAVVVDADKSHVPDVHGDLASLPSSVVSALKKNLNVHRKDKHCSLTGDKLSKAFLTAMVSLIGGYRAALIPHDGRVAFDREAFEHSRGGSMQTFLQKILQSQSFERFIEERVTFAKYRKGLSDVFEEAIEEVEAKHKGSVKHKVNNLKPDKKTLADITKKVKKSSAKTFNSVKKKLEFKKNSDDFYGEGKAVRYPEEETRQAVTQGSMLPAVQPSENANDNQITLVVSPVGDLIEPPSLLRRQRPSPRMLTINRRHSFIMSKADAEDGGLPMDLARNSALRKYSCDDLANQVAEDDAATLSSCSAESFHEVENSKTMPVIAGNWSEAVVTHPSIETEAGPSDRDASISVKPRLGVLGPHKSNSLDDLDEGHSEDDVVGDIETKASAAGVNRLNKDPILEFPSVRRLVKALQPTNPVRRKAVISVQELPNVKQIIQRIEATSKPHETTQHSILRTHEAPHTAASKSQEEEHVAKTDADNESSFVGRQAAIYSMLDRKAGSSLSRKQAIRVTGPRIKKPSASDSVDGGESDTARKDENRGSYQNSERFHEILDLVKTERNSGFLEVNNPYEHDFGCLLRVSTKSASMRQLNLIEQRQSGSLKRSLPVSDAARDNVQRVRAAIYEPSNSDGETTTDDSKRPACRNALYVPFQTKSSATEAVEVDDSDDSVSEVEIAIPVINYVDLPNDLARSLDYEILSREGSTSAEPGRTSQSPEFSRTNRSLRQSWSFDGVIVEKRDVLEILPLPNEQSFPGKPFMPGPNREMFGSSDEGSLSECSAVFDELDLGPSKQRFSLVHDSRSPLSIDSDV